ncbi:2-methylfumaryl-CoA isomerase [bioreactor metagenome]|uniref:2-methylfumaryl-CoA isomerase n=1 Tax=bioreactor metagenome TaxID=1076179 RepID=A0A645AY90_9ZZZZ
MVAITGRQWTGLVESLGLKAQVGAVESALGVSFTASEGDRFIHRDALFPLFEKAIGALPLADVRGKFESNGVLWSTYQTLSEAITKDPRLSLSAPLFSMLEQPSGLTYPVPGAVATFSGDARQSAVRAPRLGEHTDQVLSEVLALTSARIGELHDAGVIATA